MDKRSLSQEEEKDIEYVQWFYDEHIVKYAEIYLRIIVSALVGMFLGWDRSAKNKPAGLKTFTFVSVSCTLITLVSIHSAVDFGSSNINNRMDPMRLTAQIVSGLGFLGAGLIMKDGFRVTGLTSAAMIFFAGGVGIGIGAGYYGFVLFAVLVTFILAKVSQWIEHRETKGKEKQEKKKDKKEKSEEKKDEKVEKEAAKEREAEKQVV
ncbi:MgtC/SapB family protein [Sporosarcina sp. FSL W7-1349]|uniref:MgtC/SapB family protein n=1 Tax=Sporosarcina sp. FSL W7-1349 TaxID=2921561 RepID=UPI004046EED5